ncbi:MAG: hypothetical protein RSD81_10335 [Pseudomonas sp.]
MFEENDDGNVNAYINILVTDFVTGFKSVYVSVDAPVKRFTHPRFDIHVVIDAPTQFNVTEVVGNNVFFIEKRPQGRCLSENQYQIIYEGAEGDSAGFYQWACECVGFFKIVQFNFGMVCVDYAEFLTALSFCEGTTLRFEKLTYEHHAVVPYDKHSGPPYRVIYGCLDGGPDLSLGHYGAFSEVLEASNPQLVMMKVAMKLTKSPVYAMMLLGEAVHQPVGLLGA